MEIAPGAHHFRHYLSLGRQRALLDCCRALVDGAVPAYVPVVRGGGFPAPAPADAARLLFGGLKRRDPIEAIPLESGNAFVFGGPARLRYHGVSRIAPLTASAALEIAGRFNLTFRQSDEACRALSS